MSTVYFSKEKKIKFAARVNEPSVPVVISFFNTDGTGHDISSYDFKLKVSSGSLQLFELSVGSGLTVGGDDNNQLTVELTQAIASQRLGVYFARLYNTDGTWLSGSFEFYEEARDSSTPNETITITENGTPVTVTIAGSVGEVSYSGLNPETSVGRLASGTDISGFTANEILELILVGVWILKLGVWDDTGYWIDSKIWND